MSYEIPNFNVGILPANVDMSGTPQDGTPTDNVFQYTAVVVVPANHTQGYGQGGAGVQAAPSAGVPALGLLQNNPQLGEAAEVMSEGISKALLGATVSIGQLLMCSNQNGNGASVLIPATSGNYAIAQALESGVSGAIAAVYLRNFGKQ